MIIPAVLLPSADAAAILSHALAGENPVPSDTTVEFVSLVSILDARYVAFSRDVPTRRERKLYSAALASRST